MIRSMTGYGREQRIIDQREITVEIKSVNHRYYEFTARVPRIYGFIEEKLKSYIKDSISRGKVEVNVTINNLNGKEANINVDKLMAAGYINALKIANSELNLTDDITLSTLIKFSDIFNVQKVAEDEEKIWGDVCSVAKDALAKFIQEIGLPTTLKELGVTDKEQLKEIAESCGISAGSYKKMTHEEILEIFQECYE